MLFYLNNLMLESKYKIAINLTENLGLKPRPCRTAFVIKLVLAVKRTQKKRSRSSGQVLIRNPGSMNPKSCINVGVKTSVLKTFSNAVGQSV